MKGKPEGYVLKVALIGAPDTWRTIRMRTDSSLSRLHLAIYEAFGHRAESIYCFYMPKPECRGRDALRDADEYADPNAIDDVGDMYGPEPHNASKTRLADLKLTPRRKLYYLCDVVVGKWWHTVTLERECGEIGHRDNGDVIEEHGTAPDESTPWPPGGAVGKESP